MPVTSSKAGKLSQELLNSLIEHRPDQAAALEKAWRMASGRLSQKWADERLWTVMFDEVPSNEAALAELKQAIVIFYDHPADTAISRAFRKILQDLQLFSSGIILKTVREYTDTLAEELFLADSHFRGMLQASTDPVSLEIIKRAGPLLKPPVAVEEAQDEPQDAVPPEAAAVEEEPAPLPKKGPKAYEAWIAEEPHTKEILRIQQLAEDWRSPAVEFPTEESAEPSAEMEESSPDSLPEENAYLQPGSMPEGIVKGETELYDPWARVEDEETPLNPPEEAAPRLPVTRSLSGLKTGPLTESSVPPPELQIRAELASEVEVERAKREKSITRRLGKLFSRREKEPSAEVPDQVSLAEPETAEVVEPAPVEPIESIESSELPAETLPESESDALAALRGELEIQPSEEQVMESQPEAATEPDVEILLDMARFGVAPASEQEIPPEIHQLEETPEPEIVTEPEAEIPLDMARFGEAPAESIPEASAFSEASPEQSSLEPESIPQEMTAEVLPVAEPVLEAPIPEPESDQPLEQIGVLPESTVESEPVLESSIPEAEPIQDFISAEPLAVEPSPSQTEPLPLDVLPEEPVETATPEPEAKALVVKPAKAGRAAGKSSKPATKKAAKPQKAVKLQAKAKHQPRKKVQSEVRFVGRQEELKKLVNWLKKSRRPVVIGQAASVGGSGGVGKTCLAREYAALHAGKYPGGIIWLNFADPELISHQIGKAAADQEQSLKLRVKQVLTEWQDKQRRLLILDNCEDPPLLAEWLPSTGNSHVLVISRASEWVPDEAEFISIGLFNRADSLALLSSKLADLSVEQKSLEALASTLGDLPLALNIAAGCLKAISPRLTVTEYLNRLAETDRPITHWVRNGKLPAESTDLNIGRVVKVCLDQLDETQPSEGLSLQILQWLAACAPDELIPREFLYTLTSKPAFNAQDLEESLERLVAFGLIEETNSGQVRIHAAVAKFVRLFLPGEDASQLVGQALLTAAIEANQARTPHSLLPLLLHIKHVTDHLIEGKPSELSARLSSELGYYFEKVADLSLAQYYYERALTINHKMLGQVHPETAVCLSNLGHLLGRIGDYKNARIYYEEALEVRRKLLGNDHADTARSLNNLGHLLQVMGETQAALPCFEEALAIRRKTLGDHHPDTAVSLSNLGGLLGSMGQTTLARSDYEQALSIRKAALGPENLETAATMNELGSLLQKAGEFGAARSYHEGALAIQRKLLGEECPETARSLNSLGELMLAKANYKEAQYYFEQALAIRRKVLGDDDLETSATLNNLGMALQMQGDYHGAQSTLTEALAVRQNSQAPITLDAAMSLERLGDLSMLNGDSAAAQGYFDQATTIRKSLVPPRPTRFRQLGKKGRVYVISLLFLALALVGLGLMVPAPTPVTLNWNNLNPGAIPLLQPFKLFSRPTTTWTPTVTSTPTFTFTITSTRTRTPTHVIIFILPVKTSTFTSIPSTWTPTKTVVYWTFTYTPTNPPIPTVISPTETVTITPTYTLIPSKTSSPTTRFTLVPTDTTAPTDTPTPRFTPLPTDTPEPPTATP